MVHLGVTSKKHQLNLFYSPKCVCTLSRRLWYVCHPEDMIRPTPTNYWHEINFDFSPPVQGFKGILVIRDPFTRAVSMYNQQVCMVFHHGYDNHYRDICKFFNKQDITFLDFCIYLYHRKADHWNSTDLHLLPQTYIPPEYRNVLSKEDFTNGQLYLIRCEQDLQTQYRDIYTRHLATDAAADTILKQIADFFSMTNEITNKVDRGDFPDLPEDCSQINMCGWSRFPNYHRFKTPLTEALIKHIYKDDYDLLSYN